MSDREITINMLLSDIGEDFTFVLPFSDLDASIDADSEDIEAAIYKWFRATSLDVDSYHIEDQSSDQ